MAAQPERSEPARVLPTAAYPGWEAIYADNVERIYRLMYAKVGNRQDAEDLTSQVFLTAFGPLRATASVGEVRSYLLSTARTVLAGHWRATLGHQVTVIDVDAVGLEDFSEPGRDERSSSRTDERIGTILSGLPERHRAILTLRFLRGYSIKAAAAELGVTVANAKVLQHRALRRAAGLDQVDQTGKLDQIGNRDQFGKLDQTGQRDQIGEPGEPGKRGRPGKLDKEGEAS